jgi:putative oxidoreductase
MKFGLTLLRAIVGGLFVGHGLQKLAGKFGGSGPEGTGESFEKLGMRPGKTQAIAAGASETAGGALLAAGALTPVAGTLLTATMATAIKTVHAPKGPWNSNGGYEYNLVLIALLFAVTDVGPGSWSVDAARGRERWGAGWALAQLGFGLAGSAAAIAYGQAQDDSSDAPAAAQTAGDQAVAPPERQAVPLPG